MSIATVITRGFGTFGSVNLVVTRGYTVGVAIGRPAIAKPKSIAEMLTGGLIGISGSKFTMIPDAIQTSFDGMVVDNTGDTSDGAVYENLGVEGAITIQGRSQSGVAAGWSSMDEDSPVSLTFYTNQSHTFQSNVWVESIEIEITDQKNTIPITITGLFDGTITETVS